VRLADASIGGTPAAAVKRATFVSQVRREIFLSVGMSILPRNGFAGYLVGTALPVISSKIEYTLGLASAGRGVFSRNKLAGRLCRTNTAEPSALLLDHRADLFRAGENHIGSIRLMFRALLLRNRFRGSVHECLHLLQSEAAIFVGIHCLEDSFVSRLKFLQ